MLVSAGLSSDSLRNTREIANHKNTAQPQLTLAIGALLLLPDAKEAVVSNGDQKWDGTLDFDEFKQIHVNKLNLNNVEWKGGITEVFNLPSTLTEVRIVNQLLTSVPILPTALRILVLSNNFIKTIDHVKDCKQLRVLDVQDNQLTAIGELPAQLEELNVRNNQLEELDIRHLFRLKRVEAEGNSPLLTVKLPTGDRVPRLKDGLSSAPSHRKLNMKTHFLHEGGAEKELVAEEPDYNSKMMQYLEMKNMYEVSLSSAKKKAFEAAKKKGIVSKNRLKEIVSRVEVPCVRCGAKGGSIFREIDRNLIAKCGNDAAPCMDIDLYRGRFVPALKVLSSSQEELEQSKDIIIAKKMDLLFDFEKPNVNEMQQLLGTFTSLERYVETLLEEINDAWFHDAFHRADIATQKEKVHRLQQELRDLLQNQMTNAEDESGMLLTPTNTFKEMMTKYIKEFRPAVLKLRAENMQMLCEDDGCRLVKPFPFLEESLGEKPTVKKWNVAAEKAQMPVPSRAARAHLPLPKPPKKKPQPRKKKGKIRMMPADLRGSDDEDDL